MKNVLLAFCLLIPTLTHAAVDCPYFQHAAKTGAIHNIPFTSLQNHQQRKLLSLRHAVVLSGTMSTEDAKSASWDELSLRFDPLFHTSIVGKYVYQSVNIALGDNPYIYFFRFDGRYSGIVSRDGTTYINDVFCDIPADILQRKK